MTGELAELCIKARYIVPMTARGLVLEDHALLVGQGRVLGILPAADAGARAQSVVERPGGLLLPGLIDARTRLGNPRGERAALAALLRAGVTTCATFGDPPDRAALAVRDAGMRAVVGLPVAERPSAWAANSAEYVTRAIDIRDQYREHPTISTFFALDACTELADSTLQRVATLAAELDAGVAATLHASAAEIAESLRRHGARPVERLQRLGLLAPGFAAVHATHLEPRELDELRDGGASAIACPWEDLWRGEFAPLAALAAAGITFGLGSGTDAGAASYDPWSALRAALLPAPASANGPARASATGPALPFDSWDALAMATRGGAHALGIAHLTGTLEPGKWADVCCFDLDSPGMVTGASPLDRLVFGGGRDALRDVWVAGRALLHAGASAQFEAPGAAA